MTTRSLGDFEQLLLANPRPPRLARWLLHVFIGGDAREFIEGDLLEEHHDRVAHQGETAAARWFWRQTLSAILSRVVAFRRASDGASEIPRAPRGWGAPGMLGSARGVTQDFRLGLRGLLRRPGVPLVVVAILAIGVGATTSVYSVSD